MSLNKEYLQIIGNNIRKARNSKSMSQQELADYCGVAKSTIQRIESGKMNPTILMLDNISKSIPHDIHDLINPNGWHEQKYLIDEKI